MRIIKFIKQWTLLCSIVFGSLVYLLFTHIEVLTLSVISSGQSW